MSVNPISMILSLLIGWQAGKVGFYLGQGSRRPWLVHLLVIGAAVILSVAITLLLGDWK